MRANPGGRPGQTATAGEPPAGEPFPNTSQRDHLVLYPDAGDGLELRWALAASAVASAGRLGRQDQALSGQVRLWRFADEHGGGEACGGLAVEHLASGRLRLPGLAPDFWYQAEIGLVTDDGGWLLLARSNRIPLPAPVGASFLWAETLSTLGSTFRSALGFELDGQLGAAKTVANAGASAPLIARARPGNGGPEGAPVGGSGPVWHPRDQQAVSLWGQLRVGGRAPPGTRLVLGGHPYLVGPGGRFAFDLDLTDPRLIDALLRLLPSLPVLDRDGQ